MIFYSQIKYKKENQFEWKISFNFLREYFPAIFTYTDRFSLQVTSDSRVNWFKASSFSLQRFFIGTWRKWAGYFRRTMRFVLFLSVFFSQLHFLVELSFFKNVLQHFHEIRRFILSLMVFNEYFLKEMPIFLHPNVFNVRLNILGRNIASFSAFALSNILLPLRLIPIRLRFMPNIFQRCSRLVAWINTCDAKFRIGFSGVHITWQLSYFRLVETCKRYRSVSYH